MSQKYKNAVMGGTFDRFHKGHKKLIDLAFENSEHVTIGATKENLFRNKFLSNSIESFNTRFISVKSYLEEKEYVDRARIIEIDDIFGNSLEEPDIDAIFVTEDTLKNAKVINEKRAEIGLGELEIVVCDFVKATDGINITSERIRRGEIDRDGNSYFDIFSEKKSFTLPEDKKSELRKPIGKITKNFKQIDKFIKDKTMIFAVGDIVVKNLFEAGIIPSISIIDHKTMRHEITSAEKEILNQLFKKGEVLNTENPHSTIQRRAVGVIRKAINNYLDSKKPQVIEVDGEEDLLTIPAVLLSPLESVVFYGQPNGGVVIVTVTEKKKKDIEKLFSILR